MKRERALFDSIFNLCFIDFRRSRPLDEVYCQHLCVCPKHISNTKYLYWQEGMKHVLIYYAPTKLFSKSS